MIGAATIAYTYDDSGNRTSDNAYTYTIAPTSNRIASRTPKGSTTAASLLYDAAGGMQNNGLFELRYDERNRLDRVTVGALTTTYGVNGLGERVAKDGQQAFGKVEHVYDLAGQLLGIYKSGAPLEEIVWLGALPVGTIQGGAAYSIAPDHLGAPYKIVNSANAQVWFWDHDPFGNGAPTAAAGFSHRLRFPGQIYDAESGLHSNGQRDYDPRLGRYVESDPLGLEGGINTYAYASNNPVNAIDPLGLLYEGDPEALPDIDIEPQRRAQPLRSNPAELPPIDIAANISYDLNPVISDEGINGIGLDPRTFQSIVGKHGHNTNRTFPTSMFYPQFVSDIDEFSKLILMPATMAMVPSIPVVSPFNRVPGQLDITTNLGVTVGTNIAGQPTSTVTIRIAPALPIFGFLGLYRVTGAFPQ